MTFEPFLCKLCGHVSFDAKPHRCNPKKQQISFYSRRFSTCISCVFNKDGFCESNKAKVPPIIDDFYSGCPEGFWLPVISACQHCSKLVINTNDSLLQCPSCGKDLKKPKPFTDNYKVKTDKKAWNPEEFDGATNPVVLSSVRMFSSILAGNPDEIEKDRQIKESPKKELVVARYKENLDWLNYIPDNIDLITVYVKDNDPLPVIPDDRIRFILLDNVGREAHTWLYHFISRWDTIADTTFLAQGNPFVHSPKFLDLISYDYNEVMPLTKQYTIKTKYEQNQSGRKEEDYLRKIDDGLYICFGYGGRHNTNYFNLVKHGWKIIFKNQIPENFMWAHGAMYALPKRSIKDLGINFCRKLYQSRINAHQAEGMWYNIFTNKEMQWR